MKLTPQKREAIMEGLADYVRAKRPHIGCEPPAPHGCAVLLAIETASAAMAIGPCEIPAVGLRVFDINRPNRPRTTTMRDPDLQATHPGGSPAVAMTNELLSKMFAAAGVPEERRPPPVDNGPRLLRAWKLPSAEAFGIVSAWILDVPGVHPNWHRWLLGAAHVRPLPGVPDMFVTMPGATHEITVAAIDPSHEPDVDSIARPPLLIPSDVSAQMILDSDEHCVALVDRCAKLVVEGVLLPDQDYRATWIAGLPILANELRQAQPAAPATVQG